MILDIYRKWGMGVMAQVDLEKRIHRNQDTKALGRMAFAIMKTFINRKEGLGLIQLERELFDEMIQYRLVKGDFQANATRLENHERPPMVTIPEYLEKIRTTA